MECLPGRVCWLSCGALTSDYGSGLAGGFRPHALGYGYKAIRGRVVVRHMPVLRYRAANLMASKAWLVKTFSLNATRGG